jgi:hypothetical protein
MFSVGGNDRYDIDAVVALFAPSRGNVRAVTTPIPSDIAELIRENGRETLIAASQGRNILAAIVPMELMAKISKFKSASGKTVVLDEEATLFLASTIEYLVTEVGSAVYQHDFKAFITSRDVKAIVTVNDDALSKMYAFADPRSHRSMLSNKNDRTKWNTPKRQSGPSIPREWGTPLADRRPNARSNFDTDDDWSGWSKSKTPSRTPFEMMRDFETDTRTPMRNTNGARGTLFSNAGGPVPTSMLTDVFRKGRPSSIKYMGMRLSDVFDQIDFMEVRRAFPSKNFGGNTNSEYDTPDPLLGYIPRQDTFVATFTADGNRTVIVYFKVKKDSYYYIRANDAEMGYGPGGTKRLAVYDDKTYIWIMMK